MDINEQIKSKLDSKMDVISFKRFVEQVFGVSIDEIYGNFEDLKFNLGDINDESNVE